MRKYALLAVAAVLTVLLSFTFLVFPFTKRTVTQPLLYNHKIHIENVGLTCKDCHQNVETMAVATIPKLEVCQTCHNDAPLTESAAERELLTYVSENKEIPWRQVYSVPEDVYFSHRRHVTIGGLECSSCHGDVEAMATPVTHQAVPITMERCMDCHKKHKVTNDCLACHR